MARSIPWATSRRMPVSLRMERFCHEFANLTRNPDTASARSTESGPGAVFGVGGGQELLVGGGRMTVSITWMTPLEHSMSALMTLALSVEVEGAVLHAEGDVLLVEGGGLVEGDGGLGRARHR